MKQLNEIFGNLNIVLHKSEQNKKTKKNIRFEAKNELVIQHNHLIEARYRLSLQEKRIVLWLSTQIKPEDEDFKIHRLEIKEFLKLVGVETKNQYKELRNITKKLIQRAMEIYDPQAQEYIQFSWLSSARYQIKKGYVDLRFDPLLKPYLLQLKSHFTKISIGDMMQLTSIYSMRFYELLKQYEAIGKRQISIKELRQYCGINNEEYKKYNNFKKDVLERAKKEINEKTDLQVNYEEIKESRKIVAIEWIIKKKDPNIEEKLQIASRKKEFRSQESLIEAIIEYGFSRTAAKQFLRENEEEDIRNALRAVDNQVEKGQVKNPKAMLRTAINEKWHPEIYKARKASST